MDSTYTVTEAQAKLPALLRELPAHSPVALTRHDKTVAYLLSKDQMEGIIETMELMANPEVMEAIRKDRAGEIRYISLDEMEARLDKLDAEERRQRRAAA